jgi:hypothetical protein
MERIEVETRRAALVLCDRGIPDALADWPGDEFEFWRSIGCEKAEVLGRDEAVLHLRTPSAHRGYDRSNPVRIETAEEAARVDERIAEARAGDPRQHFVESTDLFLERVRSSLAILEALVPACCRRRFTESADATEKGSGA